MCCLFGILDYRHTLTVRQKNRMLSILAAACEARGTDATGIAFTSHGRMRVYKRPIPGHQMKFHVPEDASYILGHTRMATQGNCNRNYNNHPFLGGTKETSFVLAHNGVLWNDKLLRKSCRLPNTKIETDSFIAVQLLEKKKTLSFDSLRYMAEKVEGSFTFTVLDRDNNFYIVRGDNPMCLYEFPGLGVYIYASTKEILEDALAHMPRLPKTFHRVELTCGEILKIDSLGRKSRSQFDDSALALPVYSASWYPYEPVRTHTKKSEKKDSYLTMIKSVASYFGYNPEDIDELYEMGFSAEELEDYLYSGEL